MLVSAVIVTLRGGELLEAAVESVQRALDEIGGGEVVVIDNGASATELPLHGADIVSMERNVGFAAGVNEGVRRSTGEWVLLLNDDATIAPDGIGELLAAVAGRPDVGSAAAQMRFAGSGRINSAGIGIDRLGVAFDRLVGLEVTAGETRPVGVFGASAGAALMRRAMLADIGGFDESFFVFLEDVDVAWRAQMRGWRCLYVPSAVAHHHHSATAGQGSAFKHFHVGRNRVRLLAKNADSAMLRRYGAAIAAHDLAHCAYVWAGDRTLAAFRGRLAGLREWRTYRGIAADRPPVALSPPQGVAAALRRRRAARAAGAPARG